MVCDDGTSAPPALPADEAQAMANAVANRQREFALGRWCARRALVRLGVEARSIPMAANRAPIWPDGVVGSITHCARFVGAVAARAHDYRGIGFDAERADRLGVDLVRLICTPAEVEWTREHAAAGVDWPTVVFSAKEALYKCISPAFGVMLDFLDVELEIDPARLEFEARLATSGDARRLSAADLGAVRGRIAFTNELVFACAFLR